MIVRIRHSLQEPCRRFQQASHEKEQKKENVECAHVCMHMRARGACASTWCCACTCVCMSVCCALHVCAQVLACMHSTCTHVWVCMVHRVLCVCMCACVYMCCGVCMAYSRVHACAVCERVQKCARHYRDFPNARTSPIRAVRCGRWSDSHGCRHLPPPRPASGKAKSQSAKAPVPRAHG